MRIARVLSGGRELVALERDGELFSVADLEARFGVPRAHEGLSRRGEFFARVFSLGLAGLERLDGWLRAGDRPPDAHISDPTALRLAPVGPSPSIVHFDAGSGDAPSYARRDGRGVVGDAALVACPPGEDHFVATVCLAAIVGEELRDATAAQAERAVAGYAIAHAFVARGAEASLAARGRSLGEAFDAPTQIGPVLVTREEIGDLRKLSARTVVDGAACAPVAPSGGEPSLAELVAFASGVVALEPGDVVVGPRLASTAPLAPGNVVQTEVARLGRLRADIAAPRARREWKRRNA